MPQFPLVKKCNKCNNYYWLDDRNVYTQKQFEAEHPWVKATDVKFLTLKETIQAAEEKPMQDVADTHRFEVDAAELLTIEELQEAIDSKFYKRRKDETAVRVRLWWRLNAKRRVNGDAGMTPRELDMMVANTTRLAKLLKKGKEHEDRMMAAECYRHLGEFDKCRKILHKGLPDGLEWIGKLLLDECDKNNRIVIELTIEKLFAGEYDHAFGGFETN